MDFCRPARSGTAGRSVPRTLADKLARLQQDLGAWFSRLGCRPTAFGILELLSFCALLGLVYYVDVHRGPVFEKPSTARERETAAKRDLRIRREVAGDTTAPRDHRRPPLQKPPAEVKVGACSECGQRCTDAPDCVSYDCDPEVLQCRLEMKPPAPAPSKCSGIEIDLIDGGSVTSSRRVDYYCDTDKDGKRKGWSIWGLPSRYPGVTAAFLLIVVFYAIVSWFFVYARSTNPRAAINPDTNKPFTFSTLLGKATVTLLGIAGGTAVLALGVLLCGAILNIVSSFFASSGGASASRDDGVKMLLNFAVGVGAMALAYVALRPLIDQHTRGPYVRLVKNIILYVPCVLVQFADWIAKEWRIAPHSAWVLLGIEAIFVGLRYLWPAAQAALINHDGKQLLDKPVYLDISRGLGTFESLHVPKGSKQPKFKYSYALSAWFTLNPQPPNTRPAFSRYTTILNYGHKPRVSFNMRKGSLRVESEAGEGRVTVAQVTGLALQTWNNIVINYDAGTMDVFLNGELIGSHPNISPFMEFEEVVAGHTRGLEGGICNVVYYREPLSKGRIRMAYRALRDRFPPTSD